MGKNNKKSAAEQAAKAAAEQQVPQNEETKVEQGKILTPDKAKGLSQEAKVSYLASVQAERAFIMNSDTNLPNFVNGLTLIAQATIIDIAVGEIACGHSAVGHILTANEKNYALLKEIAAGCGVTLPEYKALPAPTEEQWKAAGLIGPVNTNAVMLTVKKEDVSKEAITQKKAEKKIEDSNPTVNPAEITNEKQLAASLSNLLTKVDAENAKLDSRIQRVINFYRGYLTIQANKAENKEEAIKAMKEKSRSCMLQEVANIVGPCPFAFRGAAHMLLSRLESTKSIIVPFCLYRRTANDTSNKNPLEDSFIADIVRILTIWSCNSKIANAKRTVAEMERLIKKNENIVKTSKNSGEVKIAKAAINNYKKTTEAQTPIITNNETLIEIISNPTFEGIDSLIEDYNMDIETAENKRAHMIVDTIMKTYYKDLDPNKLDKDIMLANVQQHAGIIVNMFRDPLAQSISYSEANLIEMKEVETTTETEKPAEEETKN